MAKMTFWLWCCFHAKQECEGPGTFWVDHIYLLNVNQPYPILSIGSSNRGRNKRSYYAGKLVKVNNQQTGLSGNVHTPCPRFPSLVFTICWKRRTREKYWNTDSSFAIMDRTARATFFFMAIIFGVSGKLCRLWALIAGIKLIICNLCRIETFCLEETYTKSKSNCGFQSKAYKQKQNQDTIAKRRFRLQFMRRQRTFLSALGSNSLPRPLGYSCSDSNTLERKEGRRNGLIRLLGRQSSIVTASLILLQPTASFHLCHFRRVFPCAAFELPMLAARLFMMVKWRARNQLRRAICKLFTRDS